MYKKRVITSLKCRNVNGGKCTRQILLLNSIFTNLFPTVASQRRKTFGKDQIWNSFGYVQSDTEVPENLREASAILPNTLKKIGVARDDVGQFMKGFAEKEDLLTQPRRVLKSSYFLENGTINTPLLLFYLDMGLACKNVSRFLQ